MRILDTPLRLAAHRTLRELLLIGHGVACVATALSCGDRSWNIYAYVGVTLLFATRFFAGRVIYLSMCIGAAALQTAHVLLPGISLADKAPVLLQILGVSLLLSGPDLVARFDDTGRGFGPLRNFWREMSHAQRRHLAWGAHLIGTTGALTHHMAYALQQSHQPVPSWLYLAVGACGAIGLLYVWGRAIAAPLTMIAGGLIAWQLAPHVDEAWGILHGKLPAHAVPREVWFASHYTIVGFACAAASVVIALPWAARWLRLTWRA
jgi:hypothetical protein